MFGQLKKSHRRKWVIVTFDSSKEYSVLPVNWLVEPEANNIADLRCSLTPDRVKPNLRMNNINDVHVTNKNSSISHSDTNFAFLNQTPLPYVECLYNENTTTKSTLDIPIEQNVTNNDTISDKLRSWMIKYNVSLNSGNSLLALLISEGLNLPKDVRTLLRTPKVHCIQSLSHGFYIHLGLEEMILPILNKCNAKYNIPDHILKIGINIDGLPISHSSKSQLWPILISILNLKELPNNVIPVGIFHGMKKPNNIEEFMNPFITDLLNVLSEGLNVNGTLFKLDISNIVCDAPAKAFLLNVKSHNAYSGCTSCIEEGTYLEHRIVYLGLDSALRSNESFRNKSDDNYHKEGDSPLIRLPINITNTVALDYMHNVCLGVVKRLILFWVRGKKDVRLTDANKISINDELLVLRPYLPSEFCRLPRPLDDIEYFKATELRNFLLYYGQIVLKSNLKRSFYKHFMLLVFGIRILACPETCHKYNDKASQFLKKFVTDYVLLYGSQFVTYNVHSLIHLPMFVTIHGPLDNFSSFRYENYLQEIKKSIKSAKYPLQETFNRIKEKHNNDTLKKLSQYPLMFKEFNNNIPSLLFSANDKLYEKIILQYSNIQINILKEKDKYLMLKDNSIVSVSNIVKAFDKPVYIIVKKFTDIVDSISVLNMHYSEIGVYTINVTHLSNEFCINLSDIKYKCFVIRMSNSIAVCISLLHENMLF